MHQAAAEPTLKPVHLMQAAPPRFAAWMPDVTSFDDSLFRLSRSEAAALDPQCRLLLESTWAAALVGARLQGCERRGGCTGHGGLLTQPAGHALKARPTLTAAGCWPSPGWHPACLYGRLCGLRVGRVQRAAGGHACAALCRRPHRQRPQLPGGPAVLHLWLSRALRGHGHCLLLLPGGRAPGPPRAAGWRDQRLG